MWTLYRFDANPDRKLEIGAGVAISSASPLPLPDNIHKLERLHHGGRFRCTYRLTPKLKTELFLRNVTDERLLRNNEFSVCRASRAAGTCA
ncbi:MAG: hypothetical protein IPN63_16440 [Gammaproteobacteria bacterium]|nr:hypothetical protein [Gammaproteobacteria bacterium]